MYVGGAYLTYSELFDRKPTLTEVQNVLGGLDRRSTVLLLCRMNAHLRHAFQTANVDEIRWSQGFLIRNFIDIETFNRCQQRFPAEQVEDRPIFHSLQILNILRLCLTYSPDDDTKVPDSNEELRFQLGTACLMMSDCFQTEGELQEITKGSDEQKTVALMTQLLPVFEVSNPLKTNRLLIRSHRLFRFILPGGDVQKEIVDKCRGLDIEAQFRKLTGLNLNDWLDLVFSAFAYYMGHTKEDLATKTEYCLINRTRFISQSKIAQTEFDSFLATISQTFEDLQSIFGQSRTVDDRFDLIPFIDRPLIDLGQGNYACIDPAFLFQKFYAGVHWTIHNGIALTRSDPQEAWREKSDLFKAWGLLFHHYVNSIFAEMSTPPAKFLPSPRWDEAEEMFDGAFLKNDLLVAMEYKGGFVSTKAKYSYSTDELLKELEKKVILDEGCQQLVANLKKAFHKNPTLRRQCPDVPLRQVRTVLPLLIVQDPALAAPLVNWWVNHQFRKMVDSTPFTESIRILPLSVVPIDVLEALIEASELSTFDPIYALHHRAIRDPDMKEQLNNFLCMFQEYGHGISKKTQELADAVGQEMFMHLFGAVPDWATAREKRSEPSPSESGSR